MNPATIYKEIEIAAPPSQVWGFIGTAAGLSAWWGVKVSMEERCGGHFAESGLHNGVSYHKVGEVITYEPPNRLSLHLHHLEGKNKWPVQTELDITLTALQPTENVIHTMVSIVHRAISGETDVLTSGSLRPVCPQSENASGPTMMLPSMDGMTAAPSIALGQVTKIDSFTLQELYQWRYQQDVAWHYRITTLALLHLNRRG